MSLRNNPNFNWSLPRDIVPICFTSVKHSVIGSSNDLPMESWSVEEYDYNTMVLNFRTTSSEPGNIISCYYNSYIIGTLILENNIEPFLFYSVKIEYPKEITEPYIKYRRVILKSQSDPSYPVFTFNSHTHLDLLSPGNNRYVDKVKKGLINESGSIAARSGNLINEETLEPVSVHEYLTPVINDIYDFR